MDINELEATHTPADAVIDGEFEDDDGGEELLIRQDLLDAMVLLRKCMYLFNYLTDIDLCKAISKKERDTMSRVAQTVLAYLDDVEYNYTEQAKEEEIQA